MSPSTGSRWAGCCSLEAASTVTLQRWCCCRLFVAYSFNGPPTRATARFRRLDLIVSLRGWSTCSSRARRHHPRVRRALRHPASHDPGPRLAASYSAMRGHLRRHFRVVPSRRPSTASTRSPSSASTARSGRSLSLLLRPRVAETADPRILSSEPTGAQVGEIAVRAPCLMTLHGNDEASADSDVATAGSSPAPRTWLTASSTSTGRVKGHGQSSEGAHIYLAGCRRRP